MVSDQGELTEIVTDYLIHCIIANAVNKTGLPYPGYCLKRSLSGVE